MDPTKERASSLEDRAEDGESAPEGRSKEWRISVIAAGMLVAIFGGVCMGGAAVAVSSGDALGLIPLYLFGALTALAVRLIHRRGGMMPASVCAALAGLSVIFGPAFIV